MNNIYDKRRLWMILFIGVSLILVLLFLYISSNLVKDLSAQERDRMEIWAAATKQIANIGKDDDGKNIDFLLSILETNSNIPVLLVDRHDKILLQRNFSLPDKVDVIDADNLSAANEKFLKSKLEKLQQTPNKILINIAPRVNQYLYYEDSILLKRLSYYPYVQLIVMLAFILVVYFALTSSKKAEQNKVWVGLSKETAHQLGTPISSLMAWVQLLELNGVDKSMVEDMGKDVNRLSVIAERFSKIGSAPERQSLSIGNVVATSVDYMQTRISKRVQVTLVDMTDGANVMVCRPLFEWVIENLMKNAVDAMQGVGDLAITLTSEKSNIYIDVRDTGKGIAKKNFKNIFNPGYTTKARGWGLGLTLVKRIVEEYHTGTIYVKESELEKGTTIRISLKGF
ncbi:MAG: HAMP domain-containing sensor histidine kinase [Bacteroidales bacterium]